MNRQSFLQQGSLLTLSFLAGLDRAFSLQPLHMEPVAPTPFRLYVMATNWGFPGSLEEYFRQVKQEGYDGVEIVWPSAKPEQQKIRELLDLHGLEAGFLVIGWQQNPAEHLAYARQAIREACTLPGRKPLYINWHSGRDFYSYEQNRPFIELGQELRRETGIPLYHETHRGRMCFAAHVTRDYLLKHPDLELTLDISHWCAVHESLLDDQPDAVSLALQRTRHIHARIGHPEGPQVNDPRAPEWEAAVNRHLSWWDRVMEERRKTGGNMTVLTEFGPPDYMPTVPYSRKPVADQWAINVHMMQLIRKRYS